MPFIEHSLKRSDLTGGVKLIRKNETNGIEQQAKTGDNSMVCAFTGTMFLSCAVSQLVKLYEVIRIKDNPMPAPTLTHLTSHEVAAVAVRGGR